MQNDMKVVTADQMREIEARAAGLGLTSPVLMENAGRVVAGEVRSYLGGVAGSRIVVLVGPGNNGGDGLVAARHLHDWGSRVLIYLCATRPQGDNNLELVLSRGVDVIRGEEDDRLTNLAAALGKADAVIDALFGTGRMRPLDGIYRDALLKITEVRRQRSRLRIIALDLPSGLNPDTGGVDPACPEADLTITLSSPKLGLYSFPGAEKAGKVVVSDIGIPEKLTDDVKIALLTPDWVKDRLPARPLNSHKGTFGKTLVVAGSVNYIGAACLACSGAYRAGAGVVTLATARSLVPVVAAKLTETTYLPLPEEDDGYIAASATGILGLALSEYDALLVGCGISQHHGTREFVKELLLSRRFTLPSRVVVDADALNILSGEKGWPAQFPGNAVLTPHPGEMAKLLDHGVAQIQKDRLRLAQDASREWKKVVLLKGAFTVVASPDGQVMLCPIAEPSLASGGTGDVLAGMIAGLMSQGLDDFTAAAVGVFIQGVTGQIVAARMGRTGVLATDILNAVPQVFKDISGAK